MFNSEVAVDLRDKVIVITGASSGFGEQIARGCAQRGAQVVLAARSIEPLESLAQELRAHGGRALALATDITSEADVARLAATTLARFGRADVLVANAGFGVFERVADAPIEDLQKMIGESDRRHALRQGILAKHAPAPQWAGGDHGL